MSVLKLSEIVMRSAQAVVLKLPFNFDFAALRSRFGEFEEMTIMKGKVVFVFLSVQEVSSRCVPTSGRDRKNRRD